MTHILIKSDASLLSAPLAAGRYVRSPVERIKPYLVLKVGGRAADGRTEA